MIRSSCAPVARLYNFGPTTARLREQIVRGLRQSTKKLPACLLFDARGARLYERLCRSPDYYFDRAERALLRRHGAEIGRCFASRSLVVEYGSGACRTSQALLRHLSRPAAFVPVDRSMAQLKRGLRRLERQFPQLPLLPVRADFTGRFALPTPERRSAGTVIYLAGATLGTLAPSQAAEVLRGMARLCGRRGGVLVGIDLNPDPRRLERAIDDRQGLTKALNLNVLSHANRRFAGNFQPRRFWHYSFYNEPERRVELHLLSQADQLVTVGGARIGFRKGESVRTECFHRYDLRQFQRLAASAGLRAEQFWRNDDESLALQLLSAADR